ncbi:major facilitator superfamily domain-containing protein [Xylariomycetidae sp. FL2044]|nr:major facilitator superfamily domain-containing protein [Xylariomycetidae sp. FL2044]
MHPSTDTAECTTAARPGDPDVTDGGPETLSRAEIERLGRERPACLPTAWAEVAFVFAVLASMGMSEYFISGFNIVLPAIVADLRVPEAARTWPAAVINLTTAALLLPCARLCDRHGGRAVFLAGHAWLLLWSLVAGFSRGPTMLIVCRAMQGLGSAAFAPANLALLGQVYSRPGPRKNMIYSLYGAFSVIGFYFGIIMGAVTGQLLSWRWYFWIGTVFVLVVFVTGLFFIPKGLGADPSIGMDWWGVCTIVPGLALVVYALSDGGHAPDGWRTPYIYVTFVGGGLLLCAAVYVQGWISARPLIPAELFRSKYMIRLSASLFCSFGVFGLFLFYASFYIEDVLHTTPLQTAAWFTPLCLGGIVLALTGGFVLHLLPGTLLLIISSVGFILSVLLFAVLPAKLAEEAPQSNFLYWAYVFPAMLCGTIGVDIAFNVANVYITTTMPRRLQATAGALINSLLYLGMAFWLGVGELAVSTSVEQADGDRSLSLLEQYRIGFWAGVGLAALALCITLTVRIKEAAADLTADEKAAMEQTARET